jgi:hypothetical protein
MVVVVDMVNVCIFDLVVKYDEWEGTEEVACTIRSSLVSFAIVDSNIRFC